MIGGNLGKDYKRFGEGRSRLDMLTQIAKRNWHLASHYGSDALASTTSGISAGKGCIKLGEFRLELRVVSFELIEIRI